MTENSDEGNKSADVMLVPTLEFYERSYAKSCDGNDQKALLTFKNYESKEKLRRLQAELQWVKESRVSEVVCDRVIGKKRKSRHQSYEHWAKLMLLWIVSKR